MKLTEFAEKESEAMIQEIEKGSKTQLDKSRINLVEFGCLAFVHGWFVGKNIIKNTNQLDDDFSQFDTEEFKREFGFYRNGIVRIIARQEMVWAMKHSPYFSRN